MDENIVRRLRLLMAHSQMYAGALSFVHTDGTIGPVAYEAERVLLVSDLEWALEGGPPDEREEELQQEDAA